MVRGHWLTLVLVIPIFAGCLASLEQSEDSTYEWSPTPDAPLNRQDESCEGRDCADAWMRMHSLTWNSADPAAVMPINGTSDVVVAARTLGPHDPMDVLGDPFVVDQEHMVLARLSPSGDEPVWIIEEKLPDDEGIWRGSWYRATIWLLEDETEGTITAIGFVNVNGVGFCLRILQMEPDLGSGYTSERECFEDGGVTRPLLETPTGYEVRTSESEIIEGSTSEDRTRVLRAVHYNLDDREETWRFEWVDPSNRMVLTDVVQISGSDDVIATFSRTGELENGLDTVFRVDMTTGEVVWKNTTDWFTPGDIIIHEELGSVIVTGVSNWNYRNLPVRAYDLENGTLLWANNQPPSDSKVFSNPVVGVDHDRARLYYGARLMIGPNTINSNEGVPLGVLAVDMKNGATLWNDQIQSDPGGNEWARGLIVDEPTGRVLLAGQMQPEEGPGAFIQSYDGATGQRIAFWGDQAPDNQRSTLGGWHVAPDSDIFWMLVRDPEIGSGFSVVGRSSGLLR